MTTGKSFNAKVARKCEGSSRLPWRTFAPFFANFALKYSCPRHDFHKEGAWKLQ